MVSTYIHVVVCMCLRVLLIGLCHLFLAPTGTPQRVTVITVTSTMVELSWEPPLEQDRNGVIQSYTVIVFEVTTNTTLQVHHNLTSTSISLSSLHPSYRYLISLAAYTVDLGPFKFIDVTAKEAGE